MSNNFNIAKELLNKNGSITGLALGNSMEPLLRSNRDNAVITVANRPLKTNDVVLYRKLSTNELILHRIIKITENGFIIRGDNVYYKEMAVKKDDILGLLDGFYRNGKYHPCENNIPYRLYVFYIRTSYPLRFFIHKLLSLCKRIFRKLKNILA